MNDNLSRKKEKKVNKDNGEYSNKVYVCKLCKFNCHCDESLAT